MGKEYSLKEKAERIKKFFVPKAWSWLIRAIIMDSELEIKCMEYLTRQKLNTTAVKNIYQITFADYINNIFKTVTSQNTTYPLYYQPQTIDNLVLAMSQRFRDVSPEVFQDFRAYTQERRYRW